MRTPCVLESERVPAHVGKPVQLLERVMMAAPATEYRWLDRFRRACEADLPTMLRIGYPASVTAHWIQTAATSRPYGLWEIGERLVVVVPVDTVCPRHVENPRGWLAPWIVATERRRSGRAFDDAESLVTRWCARRSVALRTGDGTFRPIELASPLPSGCAGRAPPHGPDALAALAAA